MNFNLMGCKNLLSLVLFSFSMIKKKKITTFF